MTRPIRRLLATIALVSALLLAGPAAALADIPPRVSLQTGPAACQLQAVLENFPAGTITVHFTSRDHADVLFPFTFTGGEGGSDRLLTSGPFVAGTWRASVGTATSGTVNLPATCGPASASTPTITTDASQDVLPFTGADPWPLATSGAALLILGAVAVWHSRARGAGRGV